MNDFKNKIMKDFEQDLYRCLNLSLADFFHDPYFLRTLQTNFRPLGASIVIAGTLGLAGRQGISTHL
jgi:hypothetical protein